MRVYLYALSVFCGVVLTVHLAMNGKVGAVVNNARMGNMVFWCIGAAMAILIGISGWQSSALAALKQVPPILLTAGAMGASLVFAIAWLIPRIGAGPFTLTLLTGQIVSAMVISHYGWLGSPVQPMTMKSIIGAAIMFAGVVLATF
jgi:transporter family-2 protein